MMMRSSSILAISLLVAGVSHAQTESSVLDKIVNEGKNNSQARQILNYLSRDIGHRLTASPNLDKAYQWTMAKFKEFGCVNVRLEEWSEWPVGFHRGPSTGKIIAPEAMDLEFTTPAWTAGTKGPARGAAVLNPKTKADFEAVKDSLKGKWVVYDTPMPRAPRGRQGQAPPEPTGELKERLELEEMISKAGILGRITASRSDLVITSGQWNIDPENLPTDVQVLLRKTDHDKTVAWIKEGKPVQFEFNLNHTFIKGPRKNYNVVAEIPGTEKPDEVVIMGAHIDTWDGPGSEGAADNGNGSTVTLEAARILNKIGLKPKRTIRFVLFSGEEQGLYGSRAYVEMHKDTLDKISAVFIEDGGGNYEGGTYALESMVPMFDPVLEVMNKAFPDLPMKIRTVAVMPRGGGSDHVPFNAVGVPGFFWDEVGTFDYTYVHHTQHDKATRIPENYLVQSATNSAVTLAVMANAPTMMPRAPQPATTTGGGR